MGSWAVFVCWCAGKSVHDGALIREALGKVSFHGASGRIAFTNDLDLQV
jgi:hypothetical protein